jgi:hypothetical protein
MSTNPQEDPGLDHGLRLHSFWLSHLRLKYLVYSYSLLIMVTLSSSGKLLAFALYSPNKPIRRFCSTAKLNPVS